MMKGIKVYLENIGLLSSTRYIKYEKLIVSSHYERKGLIFAPKQSLRSDMTSDLKPMDQTTYAMTFVWAVVVLF